MARRATRLVLCRLSVANEGWPALAKSVLFVRVKMAVLFYLAVVALDASAYGTNEFIQMGL